MPLPFLPLLAAVPGLLSSLGGSALGGLTALGNGALGALPALGSGALTGAKALGGGLMSGAQGLAGGLMPGGMSPLQGMATMGKEAGSGLVGGGKGLMSGVTDAVSGFTPNLASTATRGVGDVVANSVGQLGTMANSAAPQALPQAARGGMQRAGRYGMGTANSVVDMTPPAPAQMTQGVNAGSENKDFTKLLQSMGDVGDAAGGLADLGGLMGGDEDDSKAREAKRYMEEQRRFGIGASAGNIMGRGGPLTRAATAGGRPKRPSSLGEEDDGKQQQQMLSMLQATDRGGRGAERMQRAGAGVGTLYDEMMRRQRGY